MKLQVTQENLNRALGSVARVATSRNTLPILANIMLRTTGNRLSVAATNLDIAITHYIGSKVGEEGSITVPARLMQDFVGNLPDGVIELELDDYKLHLATDQYKSVINGIAADEFPVMPVIAAGQSWSIPANSLRKSLSQVVVAASADEARPVLTGVYFHTTDGKLYIVSTDSYRLAEKQLIATKQDIKLLVPASALQDVLRLLADFDDDVKVTYADQQILFQIGDVELVARLIEGNYPDYRKLIPGSFATTATLKRAELLNVTKVSSLFARESAGSITVNVDEASQTLSVHSVASQLGENTATAGGTVSGSGQVTLNSRYLLDALHVLDGEDVSFCFNGKLEPAVLKDPSNKDYLHVIMPLKS